MGTGTHINYSQTNFINILPPNNNMAWYGISLPIRCYKFYLRNNRTTYTPRSARRSHLSFSCHPVSINRARHYVHSSFCDAGPSSDSAHTPHRTANPAKFKLIPSIENAECHILSNNVACANSAQTKREKKIDEKIPYQKTYIERWGI